MKNRFLPLIAFLLLTTWVVAQDKENRNVSGFTAVKVRSGIDLYLTQGGSEKLTLEMKGFDSKEIVAEVKNGVLELYVDRSGWGGWNWGNNRYVKAYLSFKQLNKIIASGGSDVFSEGKVKFNKLSLDVSGGSDVKMDLDANELNVETSGGSDAILKGTVRTLNAVSSGGSDLKAADLQADNCRVSASGGSDAYVRAEKEIAIVSSGGSDVYWSGNGKLIGKQKSGGSDIHRRN